MDAIHLKLSIAIVSSGIQNTFAIRRDINLGR